MRVSMRTDSLLATTATEECVRCGADVVILPWVQPPLRRGLGPVVERVEAVCLGCGLHRVLPRGKP